jgi:uncharacterized protein YkwD
MDAERSGRRGVGQGDSRWGVRLAWLFGMSLLAACAGRPSAGGASQVDVPPYVDSYSTEAGANGVRGGGAASEAEDILERYLDKRGGNAKPDGKLAATAAWVLRRVYAGETDSGDALGVAHRFGFAGVTFGFLAGPVEGGQVDKQLGDFFAQVPSNVVINRYGIAAGQGSDVAFVLGSVEASLESFPRTVAPGGKLRLVGEIGDRYERASVFATDPEGKVQELPMKGRSIDASVGFSAKGRYRLEVMGYGPTGPVVVVNVPIHVGVADSEEIASATEMDPSLTVEEAEATLLSLLNEERQKHGLGTVVADPELRAVALAHTLDMTEHGFFGHVSPTTGSPDDRVRRAALRVSKAGECVAIEQTPARAHRGLLESPAHRAVMLDAGFTHAGFGVAFSTDTPRRLSITLLMGRRVPPEEARQSVAAVVDAIQAQRKARKLGPVRVDPNLSAIANAGSGALASGSAKTPEQALAASGVAQQAIVNRTRKSISACHGYVEIIDRQQLAEMPLLKQPELGAIGVGVAELVDKTGPTLGVVIAGQAAPNQTLRCSN